MCPPLERIFSHIYRSEEEFSTNLNSCPIYPLQMNVVYQIFSCGYKFSCTWTTSLNLAYLLTSPLIYEFFSFQDGIFQKASIADFWSSSVKVLHILRLYCSEKWSMSISRLLTWVVFSVPQLITICGVW